MVYWYLLISHKASNPGQYQWSFLIPPVVECCLRVLCDICLRGCFPPITAFLEVGLEGILFPCMSLPIAVDGHSGTGFLGVCLVLAMFPIENK